MKTTAILLICLCCVGCGMTPRAHFYTGQLADIGTTDYALDHGAVEANPFAEDIQDVLLLKLIYAAITEGLVYLDPEHADTYYWIGAFAGYAAGGWNTYQIMSH